MQTFICFTETDGSGEYKTLSFDADALVEKYGPETTVASVPELFPLLGYDADDDLEDIVEDVETLYPPDDEEHALTTIGDLAEELANMMPNIAIKVGNWDETFWLIPIEVHGI